MSYLLFSIIPFIIAITLIIWKEEPILPLLFSIFLLLWLLYKFNPISAFLNTIGNTVTNTLINPSTTLLIIFITEVLILFHLFREGGNIQYLINTKQFKSLSKYTLEYILIGSSFLFSFEEKLSTLLNGVLLKAFIKKKNISGERYSFIINNISPVFYTLLPLTIFTPIINSILGNSLSPLGIDYSPLKIYLNSIPFQFYNIFVIIIMASSIILKRDILPMRTGNNHSNNNNRNPLIIAPLHRTHGKTTTYQKTMYSAGISILIIIAGLISTAVILLVNFYHHKPINILNTERFFSSIIFGGILYYIIYSLILKSLSFKKIPKKNGNNNGTLIVIFFIILSSSLAFLAKRYGLVDKFTNIIIRHNIIPLSLYPLIFFLIASTLSFLTGSRIIVLYSIIPIAFKAISTILPDPLIINYYHFSVLGAIISGSTFGVINSPLSTIFILSASSSESSIRSHFVSQMYYSLGALTCSLIFGYALSIFKITPYLSITSGLVVISGFFVFTRRFLINY